jgi:hypothetical protein
MSESWTLVAILVAAAALPVVLLRVVHLTAWAMPAIARRRAALELRHHRAYWTVVAIAYAVIGVQHLMVDGGQPLFGLAFLVMVVAAAIKVARAPRQSPA